MQEFKIHNSQRSIKQQMIIRDFKGQLTPPKYFKKYRTQRKVSQLEQRFGYDYSLPSVEPSQTIKWMQQQFHDKVTKFYGNGEMSKKYSRLEKVERKQKLGFDIQEMPVRKRFRKVDAIVTTVLKRVGMNALLKIRF